MPSRKHLDRPSVGSRDRRAVRDRRGDVTCFIAPGGQLAVPELAMGVETGVVWNK